MPPPRGDIMAFKATRYRKVYWRGDTLYYRIRDETGKWVERRYGEGSPKDAAEAQRLAQERADAIRAGVLDVGLEERNKEARRPVLEQRDEYVAYLEGKGDGHNHVRWVKSYLRRLLDSSGAINLLDLTAIRVMRWLEQFKGARSRNAAAGVVRAFLSWCVDTGRLPMNPIPRRLLARANEAADRRIVKRALTTDELERILACPGIAKSRRLAYRILARTGLRWSELRRLEWKDIDLIRGWLTMDAARAKAKRDINLPLTADLLKALGAVKRRSSRVCRVPRKETWRKDLEAAKVELEIDGRLACRSSMRLTFGTHLALAGVDLRTTQRLMRHTDPKLTANVYTDPVLLDLKAAASRLMPATPAPTLSTIDQRTATETGRNETQQGAKKKRRASA